MASYIFRFNLTFSILIYISCIATAYAQTETPFDRSLFEDQQEAFKEALKELQKGESLFKYGTYSKALSHFLIANEFNPNSADLNLKIGQCFSISSDKLKSRPYFEKVVELNPNINTVIYLLLGRSFHLEMNWEKAIKQYEKFISIATDDDQDNVNIAHKRIEECNQGLYYVQNPVDVKIEALPSPVNTKWAEYHPLISADESSLYFTSRRENTTGGKRDPNFDVFYEDIYTTTNNLEKWSEPVSIGPNVNTEMHDATVGLSPDGQQLFIYKDNAGDGNIYFCELDGDEWTTPVKLNKNINSEYNEPTACFSFDGLTIYFVSDRIGGFGKNDIYVSKKDENGEWGVPNNLGASINTIYNEEAVFMHPDGKTLYFSSEGHKNMGGYDIYKSIFDKKADSWSAPINLGYPINSADDDVFFVLAASGERGYYSSIKPDGKGEKDIYMITFPEDNDKPELTLLKGKIIDSKTGLPVEANIEVKDNALNEIVANTKSNKLTGEYLISLPSGRDYGITITANGYFFHSENINIPESSPYFELSNNISLSRIGVGKSIVLNFVFFDSDKAVLKKESIIELERVLDLMRTNPKLSIEIAGHTDNVGSETYNKRLSNERAKSVVNWLMEHSIDKSRMVSKGYGFAKPIETNSTEEGRAKNRRTEFTVLEYESSIPPPTDNITLIQNDPPVIIKTNSLVDSDQELKKSPALIIEQNIPPGLDVTIEEVKTSENIPTNAELKTPGEDLLKDKYLPMEENTNKGITTTNKPVEKSESSVKIKSFSSTKSNYYSTNPIPIDPELAPGIIYKVQIGAFSKILKGEVLNGLYPVSGNKLPSNIYRFCVGEFRTYNEAKEAQKVVRGAGFSDAFLISFYNGKKISVAKAINLQ